MSYSGDVSEIVNDPYLISLVVAGHGDTGGRDGCKVGTDLVETERVLHPLLGTNHQCLLELWEGGSEGERCGCDGRENVRVGGWEGGRKVRNGKVRDERRSVRVKMKYRGGQRMGGRYV